MSTIEHNGKIYEVCDNEYLVSFAEELDENWVDYVRVREEIDELSDFHWKVLDCIREYYKKNGVPPLLRILVRLTGLPIKRIYELFPSGPGKGACRMAGMPDSGLG